MWEKLKKLHENNRQRAILQLFSDAHRSEGFSILCDGVLFDYAKTNLDPEQREALIALAREQGVEGRRDEMLRGEVVNTVEGRAAWHTALRDLTGTLEDRRLDKSRETLVRLQAFARNLRSGAFQGEGGKITDVVNIGIGGSDLGPAMAYQALTPYADGPRCHFVSNVDGADLMDAVRDLNPQTTLVIVASKSFSTKETLMNAQAALRWMQGGCDNPMRQFVALSTALDKTEAFGIPAENVFGFESWVGGRYSVWGPIGLALMLSVGPEDFDAFLDGGRSMDQHFAQAPLEQNMPVMLALVGLWHQKICGFATRAVIPYEQRLQRLPAYLQQLEMESNGKGVGADGNRLPHGGGPVVWGEPGTNSQHAFFQLVHQGHDIVPVEFLVGVNGHEPDLADHHRTLVAGCLAQSESLMRGRSLEEARAIMIDDGVPAPEAERLAPHRQFDGNRPSTTLMYPKLTPYVLGQIIALYEHRVFVEGIVLGLNSFDQWGVALGKEMATALVPAMSDNPIPEDVSASTRHLIRYFRETSE